MLVREVMSAPAITVTEKTLVKTALRLLDEHMITALPVVDRDGRIVGVVSEADLLKDRLPADPRLHAIPTWLAPMPLSETVGDVMNHHPMTVSANTDLADAADVMTTTAVKSMPVVEHGKVVGVVSRRDIVHVIARDDDRIRAEVDDLLQSAELDCVVDVVDGVVTVTGPIDHHEARIAEVIAGSIEGVLGVRVG